MRIPLGGVVALCAAAAALAGTNLARNPSFETDADRDGAPDHWRCAGDPKLVAQTLALDKGRDGKRCARLACTRFGAGNPAAHVMLCQYGVPVRRGKAYRVTLWAKGSDVAGEMVSIALSDTAEWANCGLNDAFCPSPDWRRHEFLFAARRTVGEKSRFQIWFHSTGTLWVDDVTFEEAGDQLYRPGHIIPAKGRKNLIPNASFEVGTAGWGSEQWDRVTHWGGPMNRLFGQLDEKGAKHGDQSLRIDLSEANQPVSYFDYFELHRSAIWAPLAANIGYIEVEPGKPYTFSVWLRAARAGTPARLAVREFEGGRFDRLVSVGTEWSRFLLTFTPRKRWCYVLAGPDLREAGAVRSATLWLDAAQLEQGSEPTAFAARDPVEFASELLPPLGIRSPRSWVPPTGNVFTWGSRPWHAPLVGRDAAHETATARLQLQVTDWRKAEILRMEVREGPVGASRQELSVPHTGWFRLRVRMTAGDSVSERTTRFAIIPKHGRQDSRFGMNHAYPWPHLLELNKKAGLMWVRDWSLKWHDVEPEKGKFTFAAADQQIDRVLKRGLNVLAMLPFPSSRWASTATPEMKAKRDYRGRREVVAMAPRDLGEFENYVRRTVAHYKGRITWWQVFNEPIFTTYSLPRKHGYTGADLAKYTKAFARVARAADPKCKVLGGIGYIREGQIMDDFRQFFAAGGLAAVDAVDIHHYPRSRPPEFIEPLLEQLNALMDKHGGRKPIWCTEYGYYADDDPWAVPMPHQGFNRPLASEALQCAYAVRWATLLLANGVDKILYHAGTCDGVNRDSLQGIFYEYAGQPHMIYAAQAVMSHLFTTTCRFEKKLGLGKGVRGYLFRDGDRRVAVVWARRGAKPRTLRLADGLELWDIMGRPQKTRELVPAQTPAYVVGRVGAEAFEAGVR